jgi:hypothetical protein
LYNYPDPYGIGWGYQPELLCEICSVNTNKKDRGLYNPILHNKYLRAGGIDYCNLQWSGCFICYDCHIIHGIDNEGKTEIRGYSYLLVDNEDQKRSVMAQFCMDCWGANHLIDAPIIDNLVYSKESSYDAALSEYEDSPCDFDREYSKHLLKSYEIISKLEKHFSHLPSGRRDGHKIIWECLKDKTKNVAQNELLSNYLIVYHNLQITVS